MGAAKHTPGPWTVRNRDIVAGERTKKGWRVVATIPPGPIQVGLISGDESAANQSLITAAPELLAACEAAQELLGWIADEGQFKSGTEAGDDADKAERLLRTALAKARGGK